MLVLAEKLGSTPDLRHRLRQLRWFRKAFHDHAAHVSAAFGLRFEIDDVKLARAFFNWLEAIENKRGYARVDLADFIVFSAGLVLRELFREHPAKALAPDTRSADATMPGNTSEIAHFWPEGFLYANFCVCGLAAVHEQEFGRKKELSSYASDLRFWWSFRENVAEFPANAIPFLDRIAGQEPNWTMPEALTERAAIRNALAGAPIGSVGRLGAEQD